MPSLPVITPSALAQEGLISEFDIARSVLIFVCLNILSHAITITELPGQTTSETVYVSIRMVVCPLAYRSPFGVQVFQAIRAMIARPTQACSGRSWKVRLKYLWSKIVGQGNSWKLESAITAGAVAVEIPDHWKACASKLGWIKVLTRVDPLVGRDTTVAVSWIEEKLIAIAQSLQGLISFPRRALYTDGLPVNADGHYHYVPRQFRSNSDIEVAPTSSWIKTSFSLVQLLNGSLQLYQSYSGDIKDRGFSSPFIVLVPYVVGTLTSLIVNLFVVSYPSVVVLRPKEPSSEKRLPSSESSQSDRDMQKGAKISPAITADLGDPSEALSNGSETPPSVAQEPTADSDVSTEDQRQMDGPRAISPAVILPDVTHDDDTLSVAMSRSYTRLSESADDESLPLIVLNSEDHSTEIARPSVRRSTDTEAALLHSRERISDAVVQEEKPDTRAFLVWVRDTYDLQAAEGSFKGKEMPSSLRLVAMVTTFIFSNGVNLFILLTVTRCRVGAILPAVVFLCWIFSNYICATLGMVLNCVVEFLILLHWFCSLWMKGELAQVLDTVKLVRRYSPIRDTYSIYAFCLGLVCNTAIIVCGLVVLVDELIPYYARNAGAS